MENYKEFEVKDIVAKAKEAAHNGELKTSLELFRKAYTLFPSEKLERRISKLQEFIANMAEESEEDEDDVDEDMIDIGRQFFLHKSIAHKLYDYQKEGVLWFWKLFRKKQGGILGDDMGAGGICIKPFHGTNKKQRLKNMHKIQNTEGILITTYGMVVSNIDSFLVDENGDPFTWDYIILDEGHKIKNPTKTSKCIRMVPANYHYILTGTPVQNNLSELWSLFDFTQQGQLLGTRKTFDTEFQKPIVRAREKDTNEYQQQVGNKIAETLRKLIAPFFLRRTKAEVFSNKKTEEKPTNDETDATVPKKAGQVDARAPELKTRKDDLIIWVYLSPLQLKLYQGFVASDRVKECLVTTRSPLAELNLLKKISDHPRLQSTLSKLLTSSEEQETRRACGIEIGDNNEDTEPPSPTIDEPVDAPPVEKLIEDSGKMVFLAELMSQLKKEKHRTIIFSQSRKMLDIMQKVLLSDDHKMLRIDGTITNPLDREKIIQLFQTDSSYTVMLMTTQVGSVGLTLTGADRLVIFDPSWNPGTDAQAVDRVYRVGQKKDVVVYRLITCSSIEEKIYRKQIFKNAVMKQATGSSKNPYRYFTNHQLRELFVLDDPKYSTTQVQLKELHQHHTNTDETFEKHLEYLNRLDCIFGVTHHDQLFSQEAKNIANEEYEEAIGKQVYLAEQRVKEEFNNVDFSPSVRKPKSSSSEPEISYINPPKNKGVSPRDIDIEVSMSNLKINEQNDDSVQDEDQSVFVNEESLANETSVSSQITSIREEQLLLVEEEISKDTSIEIQENTSVREERNSATSNDEAGVLHKQGLVAEEENDCAMDSVVLTGSYRSVNKSELSAEAEFGSEVKNKDEEEAAQKDGMIYGNNDVIILSNSEEKSGQLSYEAVDMACSPIDITPASISTAEEIAENICQNIENSIASLSCEGRELSTLESYEAIDTACSPLNVNNGSDNSIKNKSSTCQDAAINISNVWDRSEQLGNSPATASMGSIGSEASKTQSLDGSESGGSFIVDDMQDKFTLQKFTPKILKDLGKGYRTPPVSPVVFMLQKEGARLMRDASTPVDKPKTSEAPVSGNVSLEREKPQEKCEYTTNEDCRRSLAISLHISEESSASLYETKDVSCSPVSSQTNQIDNGNEEIPSYQIVQENSDGEEEETDVDKTEYSVFEKDDNQYGPVAETETETQASTGIYTSALSHNNSSEIINSLNYTNIGASPSEHKRSIAATFFDVSSDATPHRISLGDGASQYADTQPINHQATTCGDSQQPKISIVLEDSTQGDTSDMNSTVESDAFDLGRLKREPEPIEGEAEDQYVVINDSFEYDNKSEVKEEVKEENSPDGVKMMTKSFVDDVIDNKENVVKGTPIMTEQVHYKKLLRLKSMLLKHMGDTDINEKTLIQIVDLMNELNI